MGGCVKSAGAMLQDAVRQYMHDAYQETLAMTVCRQAGSVWTALLAPGLMQVMCGTQEALEGVEEPS